MKKPKAAVTFFLPSLKMLQFFAPGFLLSASVTCLRLSASVTRVRRRAHQERQRHPRAGGREGLRGSEEAGEGRGRHHSAGYCLRGR